VMESRLERLLTEFSWGRMDAVFLDNLQAIPTEPPATAASAAITMSRSAHQ